MTPKQMKANQPDKEKKTAKTPVGPSRDGPLAQLEEADLLTLQRTVANPAIANPADVLALGRAYGNRAVQRLLVPRQGGLAQRQPEEDEEETPVQLKPLIQRQVVDERFTLNDETAGRINQARVGGQPIEVRPEKQTAELLGQTNSGVRVHSGVESEDLKQQLLAERRRGSKGIQLDDKTGSGSNFVGDRLPQQGPFTCGKGQGMPKAQSQESMSYNRVKSTSGWRRSFSQRPTIQRKVVLNMKNKQEVKKILEDKKRGDLIESTNRVVLISIAWALERSREEKVEVADEADYRELKSGDTIFMVGHGAGAESAINPELVAIRMTEGQNAIPRGLTDVKIMVLTCKAGSDSPDPMRGQSEVQPNTSWIANLSTKLSKARPEIVVIGGQGATIKAPVLGKAAFVSKGGFSKRQELNKAFEVSVKGMESVEIKRLQQRWRKWREEYKATHGEPSLRVEANKVAEIWERRHLEWQWFMRHPANAQRFSDVYHDVRELEGWRVYKAGVEICGEERASIVKGAVERTVAAGMR